MARMVRQPFHLGRLLAVTYFVLSLLWVLIAFDNPWHQGLLMIVNFPVSYLEPVINFSGEKDVQSEYIPAIRLGCRKSRIHIRVT